jgi:hypothetical protein
LSNAGSMSTSAFLVNLISATSAASVSLQANLASSSILDPSPSTTDDLIAQFSVFLASKGS